MAVEVKKIILRQGTEAERKQVTLEQGEPGYCTDSQRLYVGTGYGSGLPVTTKNLGFATFTGNNTNIASSLAPASGDFVFNTGTNLMYMLTGTDFAKVSAFAPFGSQFTVDNNTIVLVGNQAQVADNGLYPSKLAASSIGSGLERTNGNTILKTKVGSSLTYDGNGGMIVNNNSVTNSMLVNTPANTVKGRLNSVGPVQDLTISDLATLLAGIVASVPIGTIIDWAGASASVPVTYLECNGQEVSRTTYSSLFAVLSTTWGAGNGTTTFNLPNLNRRTTVGAGGTATAVLDNTVGSYGGSETHILSANEGKCEFTVQADFTTSIGIGAGGDNYIAGLNILNRTTNYFPYGYPQVAGTQSGTIGTAEADGHNNMQPSAVVRKLIKASS